MAFCFLTEIASTSHRHHLCKCNRCVRPCNNWLRCARLHMADRPTGPPLSWGLVKARRHGGREQAKDGDPLQITSSDARVAEHSVAAAAELFQLYESSELSCLQRLLK